MTEQETYDKFFADEEYDLEKCTVVAYSYWSGWNSALKRASRIVHDEIRPQGEWIKWNFRTVGPLGDWDYKCSNCEKVYYGEYNFCPNCGADMKGGAE